MKRPWMILSLVWLVGAAWSCAQAPADGQIKSALADIEKYERQFAGNAPANPSTVKRTLKLLGLTRQRLDGSSNQSDASWIEADRRYKELVARLHGILTPAPSAAPVATPQVGTPPPPTAPVSANAPKEMISQFRVRLKKITRDIESRIETMNQGGVKPFQDPAYVAQFEQSGGNFRTALAKYTEYRGDADVEAAVQKLGEFDSMIAFGKKQAAEAISALGDVQAKLREIDQTMHALSLPATPQGDFAEGQLTQWIVQLATLRQRAVQAYEPIPHIKEKAYLPNNTATVSQGAAYDWNDLLRLERGLTEVVNSVDQAVTAFTASLDHQLELLETDLSLYDRYDPADADDQANHFLGAGRADEIRAKLNRDLQTAKEAAVYAERLKHDTVAARTALIAKVQSAIDRYEANHRRALELVRMPAAASTDKALEAIARETLADDDDVGTIKRLVINADKVHRSQETSEEKFDDIDISLSGTITLTGTKTTYFYEWDQFQVATAEPADGKYYLFYYTLKHFTSGSSTTPLNRWIVSGRLQGSEIPEANIKL